MRDNKQLTKVVSACLLGDGTVHKYGTDTVGTNSRFQLNLIEKNRDHVEYIKHYLEELTNVSLSVNQRSNSDGYNRQPQVKIVTGRHPFYTKFRERMYPNGYKVVDPHYLTLLDWEFLAIWYQQDGTLVNSLANGKYLNYSCSLATLCFSYGDNFLLRRALKEKLDLDWNISPNTKKDGSRTWFLRLNNRQIFKFIEGVRPYIQPSFEYKIKLSNGLPLWATKGGDIVEST